MWAPPDTVQGNTLTGGVSNTDIDLRPDIAVSCCRQEPLCGFNAILLVPFAAVRNKLEYNSALGFINTAVNSRSEDGGHIAHDDWGHRNAAIRARWACGAKTVEHRSATGLPCSANGVSEA